MESSSGAVTTVAVTAATRPRVVRGATRKRAAGGAFSEPLQETRTGIWGSGGPFQIQPERLGSASGCAVVNLKFTARSAGPCRAGASTDG